MALQKSGEISSRDGLTLYGAMVLPYGFDPSKKYPVHVDIYGGPDTPMVRNRWSSPTRYDFYAKNGIIELIADCRASGHNGREGTDQIYRQLDIVEIQDFVDWGKWLQSLSYVIPDKIGIEGFSFGGTMTALLLMDHSDVYHYGIAGAGVYDWALYDSHYTERFMDTPEANKDGYDRTRVIDHAVNYPVTYSSDNKGIEPVMLKLTHGTGDDNVHFENTMRLIDALQKNGKKFEFMIYPDGMHGYRGYQGEHFSHANGEFWLKYLKQ
jgi:dipeptidyl-peptidase-4